MRLYRPLSVFEIFSSKDEPFGFCFLLFSLEITSQQPISDEQFVEAYRIVARRFQSLRCSIKEHEGQLYFVEVNKEIHNNFQVVRGMTSQELKEELSKKKICYSEGPPWNAAVLDHETSDNRYCLILRISHSLVDGLTMVKIHRNILEILENILLGQPNDEGELGSLSSGLQINKLIEKEMAYFEENPSICSRMWQDTNKIFSNDPLMEKIFNSDPLESCLKVNMRSLSVSDTSSLIEKCKAYGVTVNTAITAALNVAYIRAVQKLGVFQESYPIKAMHFPSTRRLLDQGDEALGSIIGCYIHYEEVNADEVGISSFWTYAQKLHKELRPKLIGKEMIQQVALALKNGLQEQSKGTDVPFYSYSLSNYTNINFGEEKKIKLLSLYREAIIGNAVGSTLLCLMFLVYTLHGKLYCYLNYLSGHLQDEEVMYFYSQLFEILEEVIKNN